MAGGASRPELAAAVSESGGLGFLAAGYKTADGMYNEIKQLRRLTGRPFGVNLFMPQPLVADPGAVEVYRHQLAGEAAWYETPWATRTPAGTTGTTPRSRSCCTTPYPWSPSPSAAPPARSSTRSPPPARSPSSRSPRPEEARNAAWSGAAALCVQGVEAGGHQSTHRDDPQGGLTGTGLLALTAEIRESVDLPVIAAGGLMRGSQITAVLAAGADAAQLGTAFLPCPESGAHPLHKEALTNPLFVTTALTRAFSGRPARGLVNRFVREHGPYAPAAYPQVHQLTSGLRGAAAKAGDAQGMALWAGQGHRMARELPAGELVELLAAETEAARAAVSVRSAQ